jgi:hypothetical protein
VTKRAKFVAHTLWLTSLHLVLRNFTTNLRIFNYVPLLSSRYVHKHLKDYRLATLPLKKGSAHGTLLIWLTMLCFWAWQYPHQLIGGVSASLPMQVQVASKQPGLIVDNFFHINSSRRPPQSKTSHQEFLYRNGSTLGLWLTILRITVLIHFTAQDHNLIKTSIVIADWLHTVYANWGATRPSA